MNIHKLFKGRLARGLSLLAVVLTAAVAFSSSAFAITVKTVPWVATNPLIPHDTWSGKQITLKGTADVQGATIQYSWDFGDGTPVATGTVTNKYAVEATHTYTGSVGDVFTARLTVQDTGTGDTANQTYFVQIQDLSLPVEVNVAIDEGLWYLHKYQTRSTSGGVDYGYWASGVCNACRSYWSLYASNINAFEANGHVEGGDPSNPYVETVARGLRYLFTGLITEVISSQTYPAPTGTVNPDSNGNGYGVRVNQGNYVYQGGAVMDAIIASGTPNAVTTTGQTQSGSNPGIQGRTYAEIVQDMVDSYAFGQGNGPSGNSRGSWRYTWNAGMDNSVAQWAAIGMIPAERNWGLTVPAWVKTENELALAYTQSADGRFGYTQAGYFPWGAYALTPSGMVQLVMDGIGRGDLRWDRSEAHMRDNFVSTSTSYYYAVKSYYYGLFSFVKSLRLHQPPITLLGGDLDWYNAEVANGDLTDGVARTLVDAQTSAGYWWAHNATGDQYYFDTAWAILMLGQTLFESGGPVAVAEANPNPGVVGQVINLSGAGSFHQDAGQSIVQWDWDLDNDGAFDDASGPATTVTFGAIGDYPVGLRVTDDSPTPKTDDTVVTVRITTPPVAPTADADGPYVFCPQTQPWFLNGLASTNPDEGQSEPGHPGDTIQSYLWELNGNNAFDDAAGAQPDVTSFFTNLGVGNYLISLKVTDTTATSFPSSQMGDLSDTDITQVFVKDANDPACNCITDLTSRAKDGKIQLVWTDTGANHYNVYRSTINGGPYVMVGSTTSTYSTYLDTGLTNGVTYYYVVRAAALNGDELCQSNQTSATPAALARRR